MKPRPLFPKKFSQLLILPFQSLSGGSFLEIPREMNEEDDQHELLVAMGIIGHYEDQRQVLRNLRDRIALSQDPNNLARIPPAAVSISPVARYPNLPVLPSCDDRRRKIRHPSIDFDPWKVFITQSLRSATTYADPIARRFYQESRELYHFYIAARVERDKITLESAIAAAIKEQRGRSSYSMPTNNAHIKWRNYKTIAFTNEHVEDLVRAFHQRPNIGNSNLEEKRIFLQGIPNLSSRPSNWQYANSWGIILIDHLHETHMALQHP